MITGIVGVVCAVGTVYLALAILCGKRREEGK